MAKFCWAQMEGKTTAVNILSTLMKQDSGEVRICGFDIKRQPDHVRQSIRFDRTVAALDGMLTGKRNLIMIAKCVVFSAQVADNLLERFSLTDAANRRADRYSGGMKRRRYRDEFDWGASCYFLMNRRQGLIRKRESKFGDTVEGTCWWRNNHLINNSI